MRTFVLCAGLALALPLGLSLATPAYAQTVSDSERAAAREMFLQGDALQREGKFEQALDKFQRAQKVFSAPTNLLRMAQCQAALGRLVESASTYRMIINTPLPPGSPPAFQQAIDQARAELPQVEPRIPRLKIEVTPANVPNTAVQIDGTQVNPALVGEPLPRDPGQHKITVFAPGYAPAEQTVQLKERETKTVGFTLKSMPGVTYTPGGVDPGPGPGPGPAPTVYSPTGTAPTYMPPPPPPPPPPPDAPIPQPIEGARSSVLAGLRFGYNIPGGEFQQGTQSDALAKGGVGLGLEVGLRFSRNWIIMGILERAFLGKGTDPHFAVPNSTAIDSSSQGSSLAGAVFGYVSNPDKTSFYGELGVGYRWFNVDHKRVLLVDSSETYGGPEFLLGVGIWLKAGRWVRIVPKASLGLGSFTSHSVECNATAATCPVSGDLKSATHTFGFLGITGYYNYDLK
jgi:hypothetical protein